MFARLLALLGLLPAGPTRPPTAPLPQVAYEQPVISGVVWLDDDQDGQRDPDEPGLHGVRLVLLSGAGQHRGITHTDAMGRYRFGVLPGDWHIVLPVSNFASGGPLEDLYPTTLLHWAEVQSDTTVDLAVVGRCGDGILQGSEACDDGNTDPTDGCSATCEVVTAPTLPTEIIAERIASGPPTTTPPTWNAHLSKLVTDGDYLYAVHAQATPDAADRWAAILRRPAGGGAWTEVARITQPHQPPGIVMDTSDHLHLLFACLRANGASHTCFQGGAGTANNTNRLYHLRFSARDGNQALRFDTYTQRNEWTAETDGYVGIGTTMEGTTWWSMLDSTGARQVQYETEFGQVGTIGTIDLGGPKLLYPLHGSRSDADLLLFGGVFDTTAGNNAAYLSSRGWTGTLGGLTPAFTRMPATPPSQVTHAFPSDIAYAPDGTPFLLNYLATSASCSELLRFDQGLDGPPTVLPMPCMSTYSKLQFSSDGTLYVITSAGGIQFKMGASHDDGETWVWSVVPVGGLTTADTTLYHPTVIKPWTNPNGYDPDVLRMMFSGSDANAMARHTYYAEIPLQP